jgi:hypothetical protein
LRKSGGRAPAHRSFAQRLIDRHRSHVEAADTSGQSVLTGRLGFFSFEIRTIGGSLILDHSDVRRVRRGYDFSFGRLGQLFELTLLSTSPERATP